MANGGVALTPAQRQMMGLDLSPAQKAELDRAKAEAKADESAKKAQVKQDSNLTKGLQAFLNIGRRGGR